MPKKRSRSTDHPKLDQYVGGTSQWTWPELNDIVRVSDAEACEKLLRTAKDRGFPRTYVKRIVARLNKLRSRAAYQELGM
jgi:hypothetical protein